MKSPFVTLVFSILLLGAFNPVNAQQTSGSASSSSVDPVVGRWRWFSNEFVYILADGTITKGGDVLGRWKCVNTAEWPRKYVLDWGHGMWIDTLSLKKDCSFLSGKNQQHNPVHATRNDRDGSSGVSGMSTTSSSPESATYASDPIASAAERNKVRMRRLDNRTTRARTSYQATMASPTSHL